MKTQHLALIFSILNLSIFVNAKPEDGFGYELLARKLEILENRMTTQDRIIHTRIDSITNRLESILKLVNKDNSAKQVYDGCDKVPVKKSGVFNIRIGPQKTAELYCDQEYDNGGWTVIQRRLDGSVNFYRDWNEYKNGFGNQQSEFWLGLDLIHQLTYSAPHELVILLEDFEGNSTYGKLNRFEIAGEQEAYKATLADGFTGTAGDSISGIRTNKFTTYDRDNDTWENNCAINFHGAWWYSNCHSSNLNGKYSKGNTTEYATGMVWYTFRGHHYALKSSKMMIRRKL
ncbi:ficolin-1-like [Toxorhynchites rutilus septentrionalis]|uniref:ficolin-1-like n=1 Tax=Toxorhynchites rutilus septentrionalis TaxID=329112 RepID=UPI0024786BB3|nr:ficolin-1-like [Toxorhynchites rutilus septentrionalis]